MTTKRLALLLTLVAGPACQSVCVDSCGQDCGDACSSTCCEAEGGVEEGFLPLFDGSLTGWRGFGRDSAPGGWVARDGELRFIPGGEGGDLITVGIYSDFELRLQWRISEGGNSGIFFRVAEEGQDAVWRTGPEMQVLDNAKHHDGQNALTSAGSNYALHAPPEDVTRPVGEWNDVRIVVDGAHVEHWLNGVKVVDYELWSEEWEALVAGSKFASMPGYGREREGCIALQDHGDPVAYRNLRIRSL